LPRLIAGWLHTVFGIQGASITAGVLELSNVPL
jgi:hypothetical protein